MTKIISPLVTLMLLLTVLPLKAQQGIYQLKNAGFESWSGGIPNDWNTFSSAQCDLSGIAALGCGAAKTNHHAQSTGRDGSGSSLRIYATSTLSIIANGNFTTGQIRVVSTDLANTGNHNRLVPGSNYAPELTGTPDSVYYWAKFNPKSGGSKGEEARMAAVVYGNQGGTDGLGGPGDYYGNATVNFPATSDAWVQYKKAFDYNEGSGNKTRNGNGNFYILVSISTNKTPGKEAKDDEAFFDDFEFIYSAWLRDIKINGAAITGYQQSKLTYDVVLPSGTTEFPELTITKEATDASYTITKTLNDGSLDGAHALITVTAEDGVTTQQYRINYTVISNDNTLKNLKYSLDGNATQVDIPLEEGKTTYNVEFGVQETRTPVVSAEKSHARATLTITQQPTSTVSTSTIEVTAEDGTRKNYTINFTRQKSTDNTLKNLFYSLDGGNTQLEISLVPEQTVYNVELAENESRIPQVSAESNSTLAALSIVQAPSVNSAATIEVTAENGSKQVYTINFSLKKSSDKTLKRLTYSLDNGTTNVEIPLVGGQLTYNISLPAEESRMATVSAEANNAKATIVYTQPTAESKVATIEVTAENGEKQNYTVNFSRQQSTINTLKSLKYSLDGGVTTVAIQLTEGQVVYAVTLDAEENRIPNVSAECTGTFATLAVTQPASVASSATVEVTAENGSKRSYTITFSRPQSVNAKLKTIKIDNVSIGGFSSDKQAYEHTLFNCNRVPVVTAEALSSYAQSVNITQAEDHTGTVTIVVTAESGATMTYTVKFSMDNSSAKLTDIKVEGVSIAGFTPNKNEYEVALPYGHTGLPVVTYTAESECALVEANIVESGISTLIVTAADGQTTNTYRLTFRHQSNDTKLSGIKVDGIAINNFSPELLTYDYNVSVCDHICTVSATANNQYAAVEVDQPETYNGTASIRVIAENGDVATYTVRFVMTDNNARLSAINVDGVSLEGFDPDNLVYEVELPADYTGTPDIESTTESLCASVVLNTVSDKQSTLTVTAADGTTELVYTINFTLLTSIDQPEAAGALKVYPVPVKDYLMVELPNGAQSGTIYIYDMGGRCVYYGTHTTPLVRINTSGFANGAYTVVANGVRITIMK